MANIKWGEEKDISIIKTVSKEKIESLYVSSLKMVYYLNVNLLYNLRELYNDHAVCKCFFTPEKKCNICLLLEKYEVDRIERNYNQKAIVETNIALKKDLENMPELKVCSDDYNIGGCFFSEMIFIQNSTVRERMEVKICCFFLLKERIFNELVIF